MRYFTSSVMEGIVLTSRRYGYVAELCPHKGQPVLEGGVKQIKKEVFC